VNNLGLIKGRLEKGQRRRNVLEDDRGIGIGMDAGPGFDCPILKNKITRNAFISQFNLNDAVVLSERSLKFRMFSRCPRNKKRNAEKDYLENYPVHNTPQSGSHRVIKPS
jgi:hypothetical protein